MTAKLTESQQVDILNAFQNHLEPVASIAGRHGVTRQGIYKVLHRAGIETPKTSRLPVSCAVCGNEVERTRGMLRKRRHHFCSVPCYYSFLAAKKGLDYKSMSHGRRIARAAVREVFPLADGQVVHHVDGDPFNNALSNLMVFANQGDHIRFHHFGAYYVRPLFDGTAHRLR